MDMLVAHVFFCTAIVLVTWGVSAARSLFTGQRPLIVQSLTCDTTSIEVGGRREEAITTLREIVLQFPQSSEAAQPRRSLERAGVGT